MPIYGYRCEQCGHELEVLQSLSEARLSVCPKCGGPLRKLVYAAGIIYKGSGYYTTDYKAAGASSSSSSDGGSSSDGDSSSSSSDGSSSDGGAKTETKASEAKPADPPKKAAKESKPAAD